MPWISPHKLPRETAPLCKPAQALQAGASAASRHKRCEPAQAPRAWHYEPRSAANPYTSRVSCFVNGKATAEKRPVDRNRSSILVSGAAGTPPRAGPPPGPSGGENGAPPPPSMVIPAPKVAVGCRERAGVPVSPAAGPARRESQAPAVCATSTDAEVKAGCIYPQWLWPGRCPLSERAPPGPLRTYASTPYGALLKDAIPSSTSIYAQKYTPWAYIVEPLLNPLPRRGRQPGARGRAARPPVRPHSNPLHPPNSLKQITGCATES
jgi:hypothetical protein